MNLGIFWKMAINYNKYYQKDWNILIQIQCYVNIILSLIKYNWKKI